MEITVSLSSRQGTHQRVVLEFIKEEGSSWWRQDDRGSERRCKWQVDLGLRGSGIQPKDSTQRGYREVGWKEGVLYQQQRR